jgi:hypothetical protein
MPLEDAPVFFTDNEDGSAEVTVADRRTDEDHRFSISHDGEYAHISYEETLSWRGQIMVKEPPEVVFKAAMMSEDVTEWLDEYNLTGIRLD